ncbi:GTP pyrophosphokinase [Demequina silvatica]|uniref:GTP pyrophosphokinase n=1 Tax=Demequina silvatica TaxID=1638988 RepID=UPI0009E37BEB
MTEATPFESMTALARANVAPLSPDQVRIMRKDIQRFLLQYEFGLREVETKLSILRDEFLELHDYNPIEHVSSRVKSPESLLDKVARKGLSRDLEAIRAHITDIAGVRVTCAFVTDVYRLFELLTRQDDIRVLEVKDYIATPKPNGYQSLHAIIEIPVFLSTGTTAVTVEVQFRTIAMDFWASLEHRIYYKYDASVPSRLTEELREAAATAAELDARMARLHRQIHGDGERLV